MILLVNYNAIPPKPKGIGPLAFFLWENGEPLVAFLDLYDLTRKGQYIGAFANVWDFITEHIIHHGIGEWRTIVSESGEPYYSALGHPWKACYHTGRTMGECLKRIERILSAG